MTQADFLLLIQHDRGTIYNPAEKQIDFNIMSYEKEFKEYLWYSYSGQTRQNPWAITCPPTTGFYDASRELEILEILKRELDLDDDKIGYFDYNDIDNSLNSMEDTDNFLFVYKKRNLYLDLLFHLRNSIAHGAFNEVLKPIIDADEKYLEMIDLEKGIRVGDPFRTSFCFQYNLSGTGSNKIGKMFEVIESINNGRTDIDTVIMSYNSAGTQVTRNQNIFDYYGANNTFLRRKVIFEKNVKIRDIEKMIFDFYLINDETDIDNIAEVMDRVKTNLFVYSKSSNIRNDKNYSDELEKKILEKIESVQDEEAKNYWKTIKTVIYDNLNVKLFNRKNLKGFINER